MAHQFTPTCTINGIGCVTMRQAAELTGCTYSLVARIVATKNLAIQPGGREQFVPVDLLEHITRESVLGRPRKKGRHVKS